MKKPTEDQMVYASEWLRMNEGSDGEATSCHAVADYLDQLVADYVIKKVAKEAGISASVVRKKIKEMKKLDRR